MKKMKGFHLKKYLAIMLRKIRKNCPVKMHMKTRKIIHGSPDKNMHLQWTSMTWNHQSR